MKDSASSREAAIAQCESILAEAGLASLIIAADEQGHSYGLRTPPGSAFTMLAGNDVAVAADAPRELLRKEFVRFGGLMSGAGTMMTSLDALLRIVAKHIQSTGKDVR